MNLLEKKWQQDPNLFAFIAVAAITLDVMRVLPLTIACLVMGTQTQGGMAIIGLADFAMGAVIFLAHRTRGSAFALLGGMLVGIATQLFTGVPAFSGWLAMLIPWLIVNRRCFRFSNEERLLATAVLVPLLVIWLALVASGHVVDPAMQGRSGIGWLYFTADDNVKFQPGDVVQVRRGWARLPRRVLKEDGDRVTLYSENPAFGEDFASVEVDRENVLGKVSFAVNPKKVFVGHRQWMARALTVSGAPQVSQVPPGCLLQTSDFWGVEKDGHVLIYGQGKALWNGNGVVALATQSGEMRLYDAALQIVAYLPGVTDSGKAGNAMFYLADRTIFKVEGAQCLPIGRPRLGESLGEAVRRITGTYMTSAAYEQAALLI